MHNRNYVFMQTKLEHEQNCFVTATVNFPFLGTRCCFTLQKLAFVSLETATSIVVHGGTQQLLELVQARMNKVRCCHMPQNCACQVHPHQAFGSCPVY